MHYRSGEHPDSGLLLSFDDDDFSQGYGQVKEVFRVVTKEDILQPYISDIDFRSSNDGVDIG